MTGSLLCERLCEGALSPKQRVYRTEQSDRRSGIEACRKGLLWLDNLQGHVL